MSSACLKEKVGPSTFGYRMPQACGLLYTSESCLRTVPGCQAVCKKRECKKGKNYCAAYPGLWCAEVLRFYVTTIYQHVLASQRIIYDLQCVEPKQS